MTGAVLKEASIQRKETEGDRCKVSGSINCKQSWITERADHFNSKWQKAWTQKI